MYNKISSIILNSGKANGLSDVYIAQPDSLKENLAGKIFIIADIGGKKSEGRKILDFLIASLNESYYNDEKILLRDKIEGLKIENIFEAAISKTNRNLLEFLAEEKIKLNVSVTNLTIGVIYENKLYFSGYGKNRALLIYRHGEDFEIINVEANASDINSVSENNDKTSFKTPSLFSSVISGEIPTSSYFVFASETLLEYVSSKDLINIITKLPPIVAAEQIKNILAKINSFIPFLGIIIKNTIGIDNQELREEVEENLSAHSSISSLNYTEQKTERMLAPAGLISVSKIYKGFQRIIRNLRPSPSQKPQKVYRSTEVEKNEAITIDLGKVKSLNIARSDSFLIKEKIFFKKKPNWLGTGFKNFFSALPSLFSPRIWSGFVSNFRQWTGSLNKKNRLLFISLGAIILIFVISLSFTNWSRKQQAAKNNYNNLIATIEEKQLAIDNYLSYGNEDGARTALIEANALLSYLPKIKKDEIATYIRLETKLNAGSDKIQKVVKSTAEKVNDLSGLNVTSIVWADARIFASSGNTLFSLIPSSSSSTKYLIDGATSLTSPQFDKKSVIYYWDNNKVAKFDLKTKKSTILKVATDLSADGFSGFKVFNNSLYILAKAKNQIFRYAVNANNYAVKADWLKTQVDLSLASDLYIDGSVYVLKNNGQVLKFYLNKPADFKSVAISPVMNSASKIYIGSKYIYIFEASSKRLAVLALVDGHLMNQYQLDSLNQLKDFTVDENNKLAYFLDGESVYKITLNQ